VEQEPGGRQPERSVAMFLWLLALCVGTAVGVGLGVAIGSIGAGVAIGTGVGVAVGVFLYRRSVNSPTDD
jgi:H+/Cl- antiporter ClcA